MTRLFLVIPLLLFYIFSFGQIPERSLSKIKTISQAEAFIDANPKVVAKIFDIKSSSDTNEILLPLYDKKAGFTFHIDNFTYKILNIDSTLSYRVKYIYLNGDNFSKNQIDSMRQAIITKYKSGTDFSLLIQLYNMDGNYTGDTNWFTENMMVKGFEKAVTDHKKNDIFTVDSPEQNWYHVVLKTFDDTFIKTITILKVK